MKTENLQADLTGISFICRMRCLKDIELAARTFLLKYFVVPRNCLKSGQRGGAAGQVWVGKCNDNIYKVSST